jgi:hypothetical protein
LYSIAYELRSNLGIRDDWLHLPFHSLEAVRELLEEVLDDSLVVVAPAEDVVER